VKEAWRGESLWDCSRADRRQYPCSGCLEGLAIQQTLPTSKSRSRRLAEAMLPQDLGMLRLPPLNDKTAAAKDHFVT